MWTITYTVLDSLLDIVHNQPLLLLSGELRDDKNLNNLRMISCSLSIFRTKKRHEIGLELGFKLLSIFCDNGGRYTKMSDPSAEECLCYSFCCNVRGEWLLTSK